MKINFLHPSCAHTSECSKCTRCNLQPKVFFGIILDIDEEHAEESQKKRKSVSADAFLSCGRRVPKELQKKNTAKKCQTGLFILDQRLLLSAKSWQTNAGAPRGGQTGPQWARTSISEKALPVFGVRVNPRLSVLECR